MRRLIFIFLLLTTNVWAQTVWDELNELGAVSHFDQQLANYQDITEQLKRVRSTRSESRRSGDWQLLSFNAFENGDYRQALRYWQRFQERQQQETIVRTQANRVFLLMKNKQYSQAKPAYQDILNYSRKHAMLDYEALARLGMADIDYHTQQWQKALVGFDAFLTFLAEHKAFEKTIDMSAQKNYALNIKMAILTKQGKNAQVLKVYDQILAEHKKRKDRLSFVQALMNKAVFFIQTNQNENALTVYDEILSSGIFSDEKKPYVFRDTNAAESYVVALTNKLHLLGQLGKTKEALRFYEKYHAIFFPPEPEKPTIEAYIERTLANIKQSELTIDEEIKQAYQKNNFADFSRLISIKERQPDKKKRFQKMLLLAEKLAQEHVMPTPVKPLVPARQITNQFFNEPSKKNKLVAALLKLVSNYAITLYNDNQITAAENLVAQILAGFERNTRAEIRALIVTVKALNQEIIDR